jgi:hypothetical protein
MYHAQMVWENKWTWTWTNGKLYNTNGKFRIQIENYTIQIKKLYNTDKKLYNTNGELWKTLDIATFDMSYHERSIYFSSYWTTFAFTLFSDLWKSLH